MAIIPVNPYFIETNEQISHRPLILVYTGLAFLTLDGKNNVGSLTTRLLTPIPYKQKDCITYNMALGEKK